MAHKTNVIELFGDTPLKTPRRSKPDPSFSIYDALCQSRPLLVAGLNLLSQAAEKQPYTMGLQILSSLVDRQLGVDYDTVKKIRATRRKLKKLTPKDTDKRQKLQAKLDAYLERL